MGSSPKSCQRSGKQPRAAYSLLEVLLALALSVVVFAAIAMAIKIHLVGPPVSVTASTSNGRITANGQIIKKG